MQLVTGPTRCVIQENSMHERTPIMTVRIDASHIFSDVAVSDPDELSENWTDSIASEFGGGGADGR